MHSTNLSKLVTHEYFFQLLEQEQISFDWILSDKKLEKVPDNFVLLDRPFSELVAQKKIQKSDSILVILNQITASLLLKDLKGFENVTFLNAFDGISSIGYIC